MSTTGRLAALHPPYFFNQPLDDVALSQEVLDAGMVLRPLSMYYADARRSRSGMLLGFAAVDAASIEAATDRLCRIVERRLEREQRAPRRRSGLDRAPAERSCVGLTQRRRGRRNWHGRTAEAQSLS